jgi:hypothetical protein
MLGVTMHNPEQPAFGKKYCFYRPTFAINFQAVSTKQGFSTINIEIAPKSGDAINWKDKISVQLSEKDLYGCFYFISNNKPIKFESKFHGPSRKKSVEINEEVDGKCTVKLLDGGNCSYFNCTTYEWFYAKMLILEQFLGHGLSIAEAKSLLPKAEQSIEKTP